MELVNEVIFWGALIFFVSILASLVSARFGVPLLLMFLAIGMLLGEDGPGGIVFDNIQLAHTLSLLALAIILFDGGLQTDIKTFKSGLLPALSLASLGVLLTTFITGLVATHILHLPLLQGLLIGALIAPTDVAAVFASLQLSKINLIHRVAATLEIESGSNDPMAIFLTLTLIKVIAHGGNLWDGSILLELCKEMLVGAGIGYLGGYSLAKLSYRIKLNLSFYPLLVMSGGLMIFGFAPLLGGNGFLAIYLAGLVFSCYYTEAIGQHILNVHHGVAWLSQIGLFLMLGLLVTPSDILPHLSTALLISLILIFLARPVAVWVSLLPFRFSWQEKLFIAWMGLRGAVPIILALFPYMAGLTRAEVYFNVAFFVVLMSLLLQGWTVVPAARLLKTAIAPPIEPTTKLLGLPDYGIFIYQIPTDRQLTPVSREHFILPDSAKLVLLIRNHQVYLPEHIEEFHQGDTIYILTSEQNYSDLDKLFTAKNSA